MAEGRDEASVTITEDGCDDFVLIELVDENTTGQSKTSNSRSNTTSGSGNNSRTEYEDFVELSIEDIELGGPEVRSKNDKRSLYGIRLFQYSPESEGNIYITNEEL